MSYLVISDIKTHARRSTIAGGLILENMVTQEKLAVIAVTKDNCPTLTLIVDFEDYEKIKGIPLWNKNGYVTGTNTAYVHNTICQIDDALYDSGYTSVDHINRVQSDNRRKNLCPALLCDVHANKQSRCDKSPPQELLDMGISELPGGVRWDSTEQRFTGRDIPAFAKLRMASGKSYDANGTKSSLCSVPERFVSCLVRVRESMESYKDHFPDEHLFNIKRAQLLEEYTAIAGFCHSQLPTIFDAPARIPVEECLLDHVSRLLNNACETLGISVEQAASLGGPSVQTATLSAETAGVTVRRKSNGKGEVVLTVLDAEFSEVWERANSRGSALVNWDVSDQRIHLYPELCKAFPKIRTVFGQVSNILLGEFVFYILAGNERREEHTIVPMNQQRNDVRIANLEQLPGTSKNYKSSSVLPPPGINIGMAYLPRGVTICTDRASLVYVMSTGNRKRKFGFTPSTAAQKFDSVISMLQASTEGGADEWDRRNEKYQRLTAEYFAAVDSGTGATIV